MTWPYSRLFLIIIFMVNLYLEIWLVIGLFSWDVGSGGGGGGGGGGGLGVPPPPPPPGYVLLLAFWCVIDPGALQPQFTMEVIPQACNQWTWLGCSCSTTDPLSALPFSVGGTSLSSSTTINCGSTFEGQKVPHWSRQTYHTIPCSGATHSNQMIPENPGSHS